MTKKKSSKKSTKKIVKKIAPISKPTPRVAEIIAKRIKACEGDFDEPLEQEPWIGDQTYQKEYSEDEGPENED